MSAKLKVVHSFEDELRSLFVDRKKYAGQLKGVEALISLAGRALAEQRGVAFIRFEHLQQEFGK